MIRTYNLSAFVSIFKKVRTKLSFATEYRFIFYHTNCVTSLEFINKKRTYSDWQHPKTIKMDDKETILSSTITFVSSNSGKIAEAESMLKDITTKVKFLKVDLPEYQGEADFISESKCKGAASIINGPVIIEDTSLGFNALQGLPGPYVVMVKFLKVDLPEYQGEADFISESKCKGAASIINGPVIIEDTSLGFNALQGLPGPYIKWFCDKLGSGGLFKLLSGYEDKSASAVCILAFCEGPGKDVQLFHGETKGSIVPPTGNYGFGWDSCFLPEGKDKTYAELSFDEKNCISHRKKALTLLKDFLSNREKLLLV